MPDGDGVGLDLQFSQSIAEGIAVIALVGQQRVDLVGKYKTTHHYKTTHKRFTPALLEGLAA